MDIKKKYIKLLFKLFIIISILECIYLFAIPPVLEYFANKNFISDIFNARTNAKIEYTNIKIKTHLKPQITLKTDKILICEKDNEKIFLNADNINLKVNLLPLIIKKFNPKHIYTGNIQINIEKDKNGVYNFQKLFPVNNKKNFKFDFDNTLIAISSYNILSDNQEIVQRTELIGKPLKINPAKKDSMIEIETKGQLKTNDNVSDFDINLQTKYPFSLNNFNEENIIGTCFIYNLNLKSILPFIQYYINQDVSKLEGVIDFIQLSAIETDDKQNKIVLNTKFNNLVFDKKGWENYIIANGANKFDTNFILKDNTIKIDSLNFKADKVNIKSNGSITIEQKPTLDIEVQVSDSKAENIVPLLPPCIPPQYRTLGKVKKYGVFGDLDAKIKVKGSIPQPDITGYVKGRNVHVLDKSIHNLHKGTVDIVFDKRILNMDILVELFDKQKAKIKGYVYMYRDGINNVTVKTTDNIDFPLAQKIVVPISKVFNFQLGPIPEMNITSGKGIIDINIQGSMDYINLNGYSKFDKARLTYNGLYGEVHNGKGNIDFKKDTISFKSERAYVKTNPLSVEGRVRINRNLNFNISSNNAEAKDMLEIINKSELLKDVKEGLVIITKANGPAKLFVNLTAKIVPVPFGQPPLPPDEAFEDMKVKGSLYLLGNSCNIEGFYTPIDDIKGIVDFTETKTTLNNIDGVSGSSPIKINGTIINDLTTKIPDVDITITSKSVNLRDTIKFLTKSYLYPKNYPDLSALYKIASKHDLLFKYKAKSVDFITNKAYAVMNFIPDDSVSSLKAQSGKVTMENSKVKIENVNAELFDSTLKINGEVKNIDTLNPIYNLDIIADSLNLENLNNINNINIVPESVNSIISQFINYRGFANIKLEIKQNILNGILKFNKPQFQHKKTNIPFIFDDFNVYLKNNKLILNSISGNIAEIPIFGNFTISEIYKKPQINGYFTSKLTNNFIKSYLPEEIGRKINISGDINVSAELKGTQENIFIMPKITLFPEADVMIDGVSLGEISDKREYNGKINIKNDKIIINKLDYIKYISSQNNNVYPITFATIEGILNRNKNIIEPQELNIKTNKNLSAKVLNIFLKKPMLQQGTFSCNLKYIFDEKTKQAKIKGNMDCRNIDIPLFDTLVKNIRLKADGNNININLFGFINDSKIFIESILENNICNKIKVHSLKITADQIDNDKLLRSLSKARQAMNTNNEINNIDLSGINIEKGFLDIKKLIIKSLVAENFTGNFNIDKEGLFSADNINVNVGDGNINGKVSYDLTSSELKGNFELSNVDANYVAETLFDGENQIYGNSNGKLILETKGITEEEIIKNLNGFIYFDISDGRMPKLGSLEYLLRASNILKSGITGFTINSVLELLNLVKTGYFSNINGSCTIKNGIAEDIEIFSKGENLSLYIHGKYDISKTHADMEILGKLSRKISTIFGTLGNTSLNTFFKLIPGISMLDFSRKDFVEDIEKIPSFTNGDYEARTFQAIINGNINESGYVQSFKWVK